MVYDCFTRISRFSRSWQESIKNVQSIAFVVALALGFSRGFWALSALLEVDVLAQQIALVWVTFVVLAPPRPTSDQSSGAVLRLLIAWELHSELGCKVGGHLHICTNAKKLHSWFFTWAGREPSLELSAASARSSVNECGIHPMPQTIHESTMTGRSKPWSLSDPLSWRYSQFHVGDIWRLFIIGCTRFIKHNINDDKWIVSESEKNIPSFSRNLSDLSDVSHFSPRLPHHRRPELRTGLLLKMAVFREAGR